MKNTISTLVKKLKIVKHITNSQWKTVMFLVEGIKSGKVKVLSKAWSEDNWNGYKNKNPEWYPLKLEDIKTWSTYDNASCIDLFIYMEYGKLHCTATIYDGHMVDGRRKEKRFTAELILPLSYIKRFEDTIDKYMDWRLEDQYEKHLEAQKEIWKAEQMKMLLNNM